MEYLNYKAGINGVYFQRNLEVYKLAFEALATCLTPPQLENFLNFNTTLPPQTEMPIKTQLNFGIASQILL